MNDIENYNCDRMCISENCNEESTKFILHEVNKMKVHLVFCDKHAEIFENKLLGITKTKILGYEEIKGEHNKGIKFPVILCEEIDESFEFYCDFCDKEHSHGKGEGHRCGHCHNPKSPYAETGYILTLNKDYFKDKAQKK